MFDKHRKRRVIYNDDADQQYDSYKSHYKYDKHNYKYDILDEQDFIDSRTSPTFNTQVDTYVWCLGNGADPPWGLGYPSRGFRPLPFLQNNQRATDIIIEACHQQGMEVWGSLRMNDIHDSFMANSLEESCEPIKAEHPEWLIEPLESRHLSNEITERYLWTALNFALPEVREYRLAYIEKTASEHNFDGFELDFTRFIWNFPLGEGVKNAYLMTKLLRQTRRILDAIGEQRGRKYTLVVHVMDSPQVSLDLGLDVDTWVTEGLVDVLVVGMGYTAYVVRLDEWQKLARSNNVQVYPSVNTNIFGTSWMELLGRPVHHEALRAASDYYWHKGANGLYVFNLFDQRDLRNAPFSQDYIYQPMSEIGDPATLVGKNKLYAIQPSSDRGFCHQGSEKAPLPIALDQSEHLLPLEIGFDANSSQAKFTIRAWTTGGTKDDRVWFRLNNHLLETRCEGQWYEALVPHGVLRSGSNHLSIFCNRRGAGGRRLDPDHPEVYHGLSEDTSPIIVHRVFVPVSYT